MPWKHVRRVLLLAINVLATALTLLTGIRENALVQLVLGNSGLLRSRLKQGRINYDIARLDEIPSHVLPDLMEVADTYRFHRAPTRSPLSTGEDRSTCMRVNSMNASVFNVHFDDVFGQGVRREQLFVFSISAPHCAIINLKPAWLQQHCVDGMFKGNATACDEYIATNFEQLKLDRSLQVGVPVDFGVVGAPYLKCQGRTDHAFVYVTDLMVMQSFWGGGSFQVEFQSSKCWARPTFVLNDSIGLFRAEALDQQATIAVAVPRAHELVSTVSTIYGLFYLGFVIHGLRMVVLSKNSFVWYFTSATKKRFFGYLRFFPFTDLIGRLVPVRDRIAVFRFHGKPVVAANLWMNHWLFISLSMLDASLNVRSIYMMLTMGTWLLTQRVTFVNFLFVLAPLTKITWITCVAHTIFQRVAQVVLSIVDTLLHRLTPVTRLVGFLRWYIDAVALLTTFKIYAITLVLQLYIVFKVKGVPTMSTRATNPKRPVYGGFPDVESLWKSEIAIDLACMIAIQIAFAHVLVSLLLLTRFRHATHNRILRILQRRYVVVGWDAFVSMDALGIDPLREPVRDENGQLVSTTYCTAGALLRQLGSSGPSGWVRLAGEEALLDIHGHHTGAEPGECQVVTTKRLYPLSLTHEMGIRARLGKRKSNLPSHVDEEGPGGPSSSPATTTGTQSFAVRPLPHQAPATSDEEIDAKVPFQLRILHAHVEWTWGSLLLVDFARKPARVLPKKGKVSLILINATGAAEEHEERRRSSVDGDEDQVVAVQDALSLMDDEEHRALFIVWGRVWREYRASPPAQRKGRRDGIFAPWAVAQHEHRVDGAHCAHGFARERHHPSNHRPLRQRLQEGHINYNIALLDLQPSGALPNLVEVGASYAFHQTPTRSPATLGDDRSVCLRVNSVSASSLALYYDDFFGRGPRREQVFLYSVSAPKCAVINFKPQWIHEHCTRDLSEGNATACYEYVLERFETLARDRSIQAGSTSDFGEVGAPFLKCVGRPSDEQFKYMTDHLVLQSFWARAEYHVEVQSSECWAMPAIPNQDQSSGSALFRTASVDAQAVVVVAVPASHTSIQIFSLVYAFVTLALVVRGLLGIVSRQRHVSYVPWSKTTKMWRMPFVSLEIWWRTTEERVQVVHFNGDATVAANSWMNHWLYISLNIANSVFHIRTLYVLLEVGAWMLTKHVSFENFLFVCSALTKLTWLTCLTHTVLQRSLRFALELATASVPRGSRVFNSMRWYVDAVALLTSFKVYSMLLLAQLYGLLRFNGSTSAMQRRPGYKRPVYGGHAGLASMWHSETACDLLVIISIQVAAAHVVASLLLLSARVRGVVSNRLLRILQRRFLFVGWDVFVAIDALGMDPFLEKDIRSAPLWRTTHCSMAALVRQLYASGPSGWVHLAGDQALCRSGTFACSSVREDWLQYPLEVAAAIGFDVPDKSPRLEKTPMEPSRLVRFLTRRWRPVKPSVLQRTQVVHVVLVAHDRSHDSGWEDRELHMFTESTWGSIVLVDRERNPGRVASADEILNDGAEVERVFMMMDWLCLLDSQERRWLLNDHLKLRIG